GAAESKLKLHESSVPSIAALGQKGGSTIAAAVINAILYQLKLGTTDYERYSVSDKKQAPEKGEG
ncbi:precorrin-8X methylmutase, partial [Streptococcus sp.]